MIENEFTDRVGQQRKTIPNVRPYILMENHSDDKRPYEYVQECRHLNYSWSTSHCLRMPLPLTFIRHTTAGEDQCRHVNTM